jgi:hypothetical protein
MPPVHYQLEVRVQTSLWVPFRRFDIKSVISGMDGALKEPVVGKHTVHPGAGIVFKGAFEDPVCREVDPPSGRLKGDVGGKD